MKRAHGSTIRQDLIDLREGLNLSQEAFAERVGVNRMTIHRWEQGVSFPRPRHLRRLCKVVNKTAVELGFGGATPAEANTLTEKESTGAEDTVKPENTVETEDTLEADALEQVEEPKEPELLQGEECQKYRESSLVLHLFLCLKNYPRNSPARYHELHRLIALEQRDNQMDTNELSRREALKLVAAMPIEYCGLSALKPVLKESHDEILLQCGAGITACWGLRKTQEITFAAQTATKYIPTLKEITVLDGPSQQRKEAAELLFQCFLLLSVHSYVVVPGARNAVAHAQQAEKYANMAENPLLQIVALRTQSAAHEYTGNWKSALNTALEAKRLLEITKRMPIPLLVDSFVHGGLSNYQAFFGLKDDAEASLKQARATFEGQSQGEPAPIWIDYTVGALLLNEGRMHMHLGLFKGAINSFEKMGGEYADETSTPFGTRIEIMINQIIAELNRKDQTPKKEWCIESWQKSLRDARALGSGSKENKVIQVYNRMLRLWAEEQDVVELGQRLIEEG